MQKQYYGIADAYYHNVIKHHGILGQKWGVRRFQNPDGSLTELGKKRQQKLMSSNKEVSFEKGYTFYRTSGKQGTDANGEKVYLTSDKKTADHYLMRLGTNKIVKNGEAYIHEYIAKRDIKLPDKRTMEKIELGLLKDPAVQKELIDSLMKKGQSREQATAAVRPYSLGRAAIDKATLALSTGYLGAAVGVYAGLPAASANDNPTPILVGAGVGGVLGAVMALPIDSAEKNRALNVVRVSYGDQENKVLNKKLKDSIQNAGYNAIKDYNDRRAYGEHGEKALIVFDSDKNITQSKTIKVNAEEYGKAYARDYLNKHPDSKLNFNDLVKDGEKKYTNYYEQGLISREQKRQREELLEKAKTRESKKS